jgi:hypothetical protein
MSNTYTWKVFSLRAIPAAYGQTNVVCEVTWSLDGDDGQGHTASMTQSNDIPYVPDDPFVPLANLTEAEVIGWVQALFSAEQIAAFEATLDAQIAAQIKPADAPVDVNPLPWAEQPAA